MTILRPRLPVVFTQSSYIETLDEDDIEQGLASHQALFLDGEFKTDQTSNSAHGNIDLRSCDATCLLNETYPAQEIYYMLLADANTKLTPYNHSAHTPSINTAKIWSRYSHEVAVACIYLTHHIAPMRSNKTPNDAAIASIDELTNSAVQTILHQLEKVTLHAAQLTSENASLGKIIAWYEQENENLEEKNRMLAKLHDTERRLCRCVEKEGEVYGQDWSPRYGQRVFVRGRLSSWDGEVCEGNWAHGDA
jgi:hypothetical protein